MSHVPDGVECGCKRGEAIGFRSASSMNVAHRVVMSSASSSSGIWRRLRDRLASFFGEVKKKVEGAINGFGWDFCGRQPGAVHMPVEVVLGRIDGRAEVSRIVARSCQSCPATLGARGWRHSGVVALTREVEPRFRGRNIVIPVLKWGENGAMM